MADNAHPCSSSTHYAAAAIAAIASVPHLTARLLGNCLASTEFRWPAFTHCRGITLFLLNRIISHVSGQFGRADAASARGPTADIHALVSDFEAVTTAFYSYLPDDVRDVFINDAIYHKSRYLELLTRQYGRRVLELGSDKPFISHFLRELNPGSVFETISIDIPFSKHPIIRIDIESEVFPFADAAFSDVIFTEVLEHLFRDPAWTTFQVNRVLETGGTLFLTTPNACGYDSMINFINQANPNARSQFFASIESGHPHLWTASECRDLLAAHGFEIESIDTADYVTIPMPIELAEFIDKYSSNKAMHGQSLRMLAKKTSSVNNPSYPPRLFPDGKPVQLQGALLEWVSKTLPKR